MSTKNNWPTIEWKTCSPEAQGVDSEILEAAYDYLLANFPALGQITVVRHGWVIYHQENPKGHEAFLSRVFRWLVTGWVARYKCPPETIIDCDQGRWNIRSAAKSVLSILTGMALEDGLIGDLDERLGDLLPEVFKGTQDHARGEITLRHLLTMTSGLRSVEGGLTAFTMLASPNWTEYMARLTMDYKPGERFVYNSANPHLLSAAISHRADRSLLEYASERLFSPLGIREVLWGAGPEGVTFGGGNLYLSSQELAKIGLLCLRQGEWEGKQLVSPGWIAEMLQPYQLYIPGWDYGYYWYLHDEYVIRRKKPIRTFSAAGSGGQKLIVIPELDLILAVVARTDFIGERGLFVNFAVGKYFIEAVWE
jgi:CubicO group peptidase (beta-lactamase class C family)